MLDEGSEASQQLFTAATPLTLNPSQKHVLQSLARAGSTPQKVARKCEVILFASEGMPTMPRMPQAQQAHKQPPPKKADSIPVKIEHQYVCGTAIAIARQSAIKLYASSWHQSKLGSVQESEQTRIFADCRFPGFWNRSAHLRPRSSLTPMFIGLSVRSLPRDFAKSRLKFALRQILVQSPKLKR
jgi:hypothetical protein